jgi:hypothetical protein
MSHSARSLLLVLLCLPLTLSAQQLTPFGEPFPLASTRYIPVREFTSDFFAPDAPVLRTSERDAFLFLRDSNSLRVVRVANSPRVARVVLPFGVYADHNFDAVWTGSHFLVVASDAEDAYTLWGRLVDSTGQPLGEAFRIGQGIFPALAWNGRHVLMVFSNGGSNYSTVLTADGAPTAFASQELPGRLLTDRLVAASNGTGFAALIPETAFTATTLVTFDEDGQIASQHALDAPSMNWSIGSDGNRYLIAGARAGRSMLWLFNGDGTLQTSRDLVDAGENYFYRVPLVTSTGSRWVISRVASNEGQVLELTGDATQILSTRWVRNTQVSVGVLRGTVIGAWWANREIVVGAHPFDTGATPVAVEAAAQYLAATATSRSATLLLWNEGGDLRAGIRTNDGRWREHVLRSWAQFVLAASDGEEYVVIADSEVLRLDANGERDAVDTMEVLPFQATAIAWNGTHYGLIGVGADGRVATATITPQTVSAPILITAAADNAGFPLLSSSGDRFLAAWSVLTGPCNEYCSVARIDAVPLDSAMAPIGTPAAVTAADEEVTGAFDVVWNGSRYVLVYGASGGLRAREIDAAAGLHERREIFAEPGYAIRAVRSDEGVIVGWRDAAGLVQRARSMTRAGVLSEPLVVHQEPRTVDWGGVLTVLPEGRLAFVFSSPQMPAPHHASPHVMMTLAGPLAPLEAPLATLLGNVLSWTRPAGSVAGYRVEQKIGDDDWTELERWFDADELSVSLPSTPVATSFRVRAFSDAGAGPYSEVVRGPGGRRRSVRK